jgi:hypothetical protein
MSAPTGELPDLQIGAELNGVNVSAGGEVQFWGVQSTYRLHCEGPACEIVEKTGPEHIDGEAEPGSPWAAAVLRGEGAHCDRSGAR